MTELTFGSVCSGIEAASVAWEPLGFWAEWFAEIEAFPSAVLAHHWPDVPNLGDMLTLPGLVDAGKIAAPDVLVGGTPCQAFSVAGNRESLADARGGLTLAYVELADAIDRQRARDGQDPCIVVWENVPGVLSTKDNAFGCFLAGLAGEDEPLLPSGKRWTNAGVVLGPKRAVAWRILDAQYFGLAQRRRRVFVVASARNGFDPSAVLLEFDGLRRDSAPRRETGQNAAADVARSFTPSSFGAYREDVGTLRAQGGDYGGGSEMLVNSGCFWNGEQVTQTLDAVLHKGQTMPEKNRFPAVLQPVPIDMRQASRGATMTNNRPGGSSGGAPGTGIGEAGDPAPTLSASHTPAVSCVSVTGDIAHTLNTANNGKGCSEDGTGRGVPTIAFSSKDHGQDAVDGLAPTLRSLGAYGANGGGNTAVTVALRGREGGGTVEVGGEVATALRASSGGGGDKAHVLTIHGTQDPCVGVEVAFTQGRNNGGENGVMFPGMAVRRLTPRECERLQGFPDDHTLIPVRGKPAADGPRYKALGNSMAVPVMRWIGQRIIRHLNGEI